VQLIHIYRGTKDVRLFSFLTKKKKGEKTLEDYLRIAKEEPENTGVHIKIADMYLKRGKKAEAIKEYIFAAEAYSKEELFQLAISIYKTVLSIDPKLVEIYLTLAELYEKQGFVGDAAATYEKLAEHYSQQGKPEEARRIGQTMLQLGPANEFIHKKAERFLGTGDAPSPVGVEPRRGRDSRPVPARVGSKDEGVRIASPEEIAGDEGFFDLGAQLNDGEDLVVSEKSAEVKRDETSLELDEVLKGIRQNIEDKPKEESYRLHYELGIAYQQMEKIEEAIEEFKKALSDQETKNDCFRRLSACFRDKEMYKHAINAAQSGLKSRFISQSEYLGLHYELGLTYIEMGEERKAREAFDEIAKVNVNYKDTKRILEELRG
jgi:tetratricopeptide (TPR) repeat protein